MVGDTLTRLRTELHELEVPMLRRKAALVPSTHPRTCVELSGQTPQTELGAGGDPAATASPPLCCCRCLFV
jgi:hypothetical protein